MNFLKYHHAEAQRRREPCVITKLCVFLMLFPIKQYNNKKYEREIWLSHYS